MSKSKTVVVLALALSSIAGVAHAQDDRQVPGYQTATDLAEKEDRWSIVAGLGVGYGPKAVGSSESETGAIPYIDITYRNRIFLGVGGLGVYAYNGDRGTLGLSVSPGIGRDEKDDRKLLAGLGDIDAGAAINAFGSIPLGPVELSADISKELDGSEGTLATFGVASGLPLGEKTFIGVSVSTSWADEKFQDAFSSVTARQSARRAQLRVGQPSLRALPVYDADAGFYQSDLGLSLTHQFNEKWLISASVSQSFLIGDAKDSPISEEDSSTSAGLILLRAF